MPNNKCDQSPFSREGPTTEYSNHVIKQYARVNPVGSCRPDSGPGSNAEPPNLSVSSSLSHKNNQLSSFGYSANLCHASQLAELLTPTSPNIRTPHFRVTLTEPVLGLADGMELSQQSIHDVIHPTAAFSEDHIGSAKTASENDRGCSWEDSLLNPKNRIDSLDVLERPLWRIDGCTAFGSQFYAVPLFLQTISPIRMDVFIPEPAKLDPDLRQVLDTDVAFHTTSASRISRLGITRHILRILQHWTSSQTNLGNTLTTQPFGSRIVFQNLPKNVADAKIVIAPTHYLERQLLSVASLREFWGGQLPPTVDIGQLVYVSQLHDSVCLVTIQGQTWIFKALTSYTKYLYHELKQLLAIQPHPNIIARPVHLVTKRCGFGGKIAVVGFTLVYHTHGSLRDLIPFLRIHEMVSLADETRWSVQLASALLHLHQTSTIYYPDLRLDNIVLSGSRDAVMVDFEQRGVWCEFAAPEVNALEYVRLLAIDDEIPPDVTAKYCEILDEMLPNWELLGDGEEYIWPSQGYNVPWACLTRTEQEACEVYMLGRVLWCIFEGQSAPQRAAVWLSYRWEPLVEFPGYTTTPKPIQELIDRCTRGRQAGMSKLIVRQRNQLILREHERTGLSTPQAVQQTARDWWTREIGEAEEWLKQRREGMKKGTWKENYYDRPSLKEVLAALEAFRDENGLGA